MNDKVIAQTHRYVIEALKQERKKQGLSHEKLAQLAGIHRTAVSHIENYRRNPTFIVCLKLANALGLSLGNIIIKAEQSGK